MYERRASCRRARDRPPLARTLRLSLWLALPYTPACAVSSTVQLSNLDRKGLYYCFIITCVHCYNCMWRNHT